MTWICACGYVNDETAKFCGQCGASKPAGAPAPAPEPPPTPPPPPPAAPAPATAPPAPKPAPPAVPPKKKGGCGKWFMILLVLLLLFCFFAGIAGGLIYWKKGDEIKRRWQERKQQIEGLQVPIPGGETSGGETGEPLPATNQDEQNLRKALEEMNSVATALESYKSSNGRYPNPGSNPDSYYSLVDLQTIQADLVPNHASSFAATDPWGSPYEYGASQDSQSYVLICKGSDGVDRLEKIPESPVQTSCYEDEIVLEKGAVMQQPGPDVKNCGM